MLCRTSVPAMAAMTPEASFNTVQLHSYLDALRAGDRGAADMFLRRVSARLERLARSMLRSFPNVGRWVDADDVLQNALLRLFHTLQTTTPESMPTSSTWPLCKSAASCSIWPGTSAIGSISPPEEAPAMTVLWRPRIAIAKRRPIWIGGVPFTNRSINCRSKSAR